MVRNLWAPYNFSVCLSRVMKCFFLAVLDWNVLQILSSVFKGNWRAILCEFLRIMDGST